MKPLRLGIAGLGTVGGGLVRLLAAHGDRLALRTGRPIEITAVSARDPGKDRGLGDLLAGATFYADAVALARDPSVDVLVELIGGETVAKPAVEAALDLGKPVVTANKALLAHHGLDLARRAEAAGVSINFEAAVAGGIPVVKALREGLAGNRIEGVFGILNGTSNYILTGMAETGASFADALGEAQRLGYAEADPGFDVDGVDAAHKLTLLASLAFGAAVDFGAVHVEGIRGVSALDIAFARELGFRIKLVGIAKAADGGLDVRVHPVMVPAGTALSHVDGVFNGVVVQGDFVDQMVFEGRGAGAGPTASAVMADIVDVALGLRLPLYGVPVASLGKAEVIPVTARFGASYLRLSVVDRPGVIADIAAILRDEQVSIESLLQRGRAPGEAVPVVIVTHEVREAALAKALARIGALESVLEPPTMIRIEEIRRA
ncbi:homoserine dehydrogenase [Zavarzinia compransoris]|uniref:Homoserine dehydrogenase n=1 Tax=Zavarzinia compransoris TaxID=1264899 RepID=A0A317E948_9PROT|nr:homoserine dehydrogenase [Zavarzinia compransoris]PWR23251.1 homoserine dehydrogenase [Zavarzinia compransoris]TDP46185.1 homoserine dehydrogenase [Zavarzinia compransoris]